MEQTLKPLVELELRYKPGMLPVLPGQGRVGDYIGSGEGTATGPELQGTVRWDLFESQEGAVCASNLRGVIETAEGAQIEFDSLGFFLNPAPAGGPQWLAAAAVTFATAAERYIWLNGLAGLWQGEFDMATYRHQYRVYAAPEV